MDVAQLSFSEKIYWLTRYRNDLIEKIKVSEKDQEEKDQEIREMKTYFNNAINKLDHAKHDKAYWNGIHGCIKAQMRKEGKYRMELQTFNNDQFGELRTTEIEGKIYYCGNDVAKALGYSNPRDAISRHCRGVVKHDVPHPQNSMKEIEMIFIPEGDVYRLTARSKLPQAEKFESWVFDEILPQIAHTGSYNIPTTPEEKLDLLVEVAHNQKANMKKINERVTHLEDNAIIDPTQYGYIGNLVNKRLQDVKAVYKYQWNKQQCGVLRHGINKDICSAMDARPRTQIRAKDFDKACRFVEGWNPSSVTLNEIELFEELS
ncbi:BRO family protein [Longicatena caecimuris]|uniref:BRO family protein n=1 Tax=Longicatena caecimuris TaxID=1796635 RepID=UPI001D0669E2|nr:BRO family protein [Longicatena caecimuris]MCB7329810.1 ORF6C domain-containing protein [Longicatena caecimuris]MCB7338287.1 ORF6C domain-containing protein [Longicatena caecimuris]